MNDLIQRLVNAIIRQEGMRVGHPNPGNLRRAPWIQPVPVIHNDFWVPASRAIGVAGAAHVVALHIAEGNSLAQLISIWAPPSENNTGAYIANVKEWAGIEDEHAPLWGYILPKNAGN